MKVALAQDFIRHGGAEKVLEELHALWPDATVYTLLAEPNEQYAAWDIRTSWLQKLLPDSMYRVPFPLYPGIVDRMRFPDDIDLLVSVSVSWFKSLQAPPGVPHLCYICRPMMFAYERQADFLSRYPAPLRPLLRALIGRVRKWDQRTAHRPDHFVALSDYCAGLVRKLYGRDSEVVYPPVDTEAFEAAGRAREPGDYFLTVARLESYKRVDLIVEACTRLGLPLKVAGRGPLLDELRRAAGPTVEFLGFVADGELPALYAGCRAFLFAAEEDFGIAPVEAMAAGRPVLAFAAGGCLETVRPGVSGAHFAAQTADSLAAALQDFDPAAYPAEAVREHAGGFAAAVFRRRMREAAERLVQRAAGVAVAGPGDPRQARAQ